MTVHTSKGMEFPYVFVCRFNEGVFPSSRARTRAEMEEERRVAYVAFTRAENALFVSDAGGFSAETRGLYPSRFIFEIARNTIEYNHALSEDVLQGSASAIERWERDVRRSEFANLPSGTRIIHSAFGTGTILSYDEQTDIYLVRFDSISTPRSIVPENIMRVESQGESNSVDKNT